jgi:hypothetical protein
MLTEATCTTLGWTAWAPATSTCTIDGNDYTTLKAVCESTTPSAAGYVWSTNYCSNASVVTLNAWSNLFTVNYTVWSASTPSYTIDLKDVALSAGYTTPMVFGNRMSSTLNLVTK